MKLTLSNSLCFFGGALIVVLVSAVLVRNAVLESRADRLRLLAKENVYAMHLDDLPTNNIVFGIHIIGNDTFRLQVARSLLFLKLCAPAVFARVTNSIGIVREDYRSGTWVTNKPPLVALTTNTALFSLTWCASVIAHETRHVEIFKRDYAEGWKVYYGGREPNTYREAQREELDCLALQIEVTKQLGGPTSELRHLRSADGLHFDVNRDGRWNWEDYRLRNW